jgi:hypothetical protein
MVRCKLSPGHIVHDSRRSLGVQLVVRRTKTFQDNASHDQPDRNGQLLASVVPAGTRAIALTIDNPVALSAPIQPDASVASPAQVLTPAHFDAEPIVRPERLCSAADGADAAGSLPACRDFATGCFSALEIFFRRRLRARASRSFVGGHADGVEKKMIALLAGWPCCHANVNAWPALPGRYALDESHSLAAQISLRQLRAADTRRMPFRRLAVALLVQRSQGWPNVRDVACRTGRRALSCVS